MASHKQTLTSFGQYSVELAQFLKDRHPLTAEAEEYLSIENHLLVVQLALALSKQTSLKTRSQQHG